jgi:hypothetical protein
MAINPRLAAVYNFTLAPRDPIPIVRGWNRLEGRPRSSDFERSLRAEVRDPLWFLTRQWQYGEFEGEDSGSPIDARIAYVTAPLDTFSVAGATTAYDPATPLEVTVEEEPVVFDLMLHMQMARVFEKLLRDAGLPTRLADYVTHFALDYDAAVAGVDTEEAASLHRTGQSFLFDGARLIAAVRDGTHAGIVATFGGLGPGDQTKLVDAGLALVGWYEATYAPPRATPSAWQAGRLGYGFACAASSLGLALPARDFAGGTLDWYAFDAAPSAPAQGPAGKPAPPPVALSFLPTSIRFAGKPSERYWEMEDSRTEFGHLDVNTNDLAALLLAEFMLIYSNDWCLFPMELDVGSFTRTQGILVTDVFGDQTLVRPADRGRDSDWQRWSMFRLNGDSDSSPGLLLAPSLTATVKAPPMELVQFLRDEMANMVWAVESRVMSRLGEAFDPGIGSPTPAAPPPTTAPSRYQMGTDVPPNWRPFLPTHLPGSTRSIRLQRARLPNQPLQTAGEILHVPGPYFVAEEEVPRAGRTIDRAFKRARWIDGTTFLWIGRHAITGRGEGSSGLVFDQVVETGPAAF